MSLVYTAPAAQSSIPTTTTTTTTTTTNTATAKSYQRRNSVYLGSKEDAKSRSTLEKRNITHILNVTPEKEPGIQSGVANFFESELSSTSSTATTLGRRNRRFTYRRIGVYDNASSDLLFHAEDVSTFIHTALYHGSVLVHCQRGISRSTTCVMFFLMSKCGMTMKEAFTACQRRRPQIDPILSFRDQIRKYEEVCIAEGYIQTVVPTKSVNVNRKNQPLTNGGNELKYVLEDKDQGSTYDDSREIATSDDKEEGKTVPHKRKRIIGGTGVSSTSSPHTTIGPMIPMKLQALSTIPPSTTIPMMLSGKKRVQDNTVTNNKMCNKKNKRNIAKPQIIGPSLPPHMRR